MYFKLSYSYLFLIIKVKEAMEKKTVMFGTVDSWILWNLTGGIQVEIYVSIYLFIIPNYINIIVSSYLSIYHIILLELWIPGFYGI